MIVFAVGIIIIILLIGISWDIHHHQEWYQLPSELFKMCRRCRRRISWNETAGVTVSLHVCECVNFNQVSLFNHRCKRRRKECFLFFQNKESQSFKQLQIEGCFGISHSTWGQENSLRRRLQLQMKWKHHRSQGTSEVSTQLFLHLCTWFNERIRFARVDTENKKQKEEEKDAMLSFLSCSCQINVERGKWKNENWMKRWRRV